MKNSLTGKNILSTLVLVSAAIETVAIAQGNQNQNQNQNQNRNQKAFLAEHKAKMQTPAVEKGVTLR